MSQFEKPADKSIDPLGRRDYPVVYTHFHKHIKRTSGYVNELAFVGVKNIAEARGQFNTVVRIHARISYIYPSGRTMCESVEMDLSDKAVDEFIAEMTKHRPVAENV